ncbi:MAG: hypothetical protein ABSD08_14695 [Xanthobacteraceae bacterium]
MSENDPERWRWHLEETYKSLITLSVACLKILAFVNGGAAVAVLTYLGNLSAHSTTPRHFNITPAILCYCGGLFAALFAFMFAYLVQLQLFKEESVLYVGLLAKRKHQWFLYTAMVLCFLSAILFAAGCLTAASVLG